MYLAVAVVWTMTQMIAGLAWLSLRLDWRNMVLHQQRMDRCIVQTARRLISRDRTIDSLNHRIEELRMALGAATATAPHLAPALRVALTGAATVQHGIVRLRILEELGWKSGLRCDPSQRWIWSTRRISILGSWRPEPPDALGQKGYRYVGPVNAKISIYWKNRSSHACLTHYPTRRHGGTSWGARWCGD